MTIPPVVERAKEKVSDFVRGMIGLKRTSVNPLEQRLAIHIRGNVALYESLTALIQSRIDGRAGLPEPAEPLVAKSMIARDRELQWLLSRLDFVYRSPVAQAQDNDEPPVA